MRWKGKEVSSCEPHPYQGLPHLSLLLSSRYRDGCSVETNGEIICKRYTFISDSRIFPQHGRHPFIIYHYICLFLGLSKSLTWSLATVPWLFEILASSMKQLILQFKLWSNLDSQDTAQRWRTICSIGAMWWRKLQGTKGSKIVCTHSSNIM